MCGQTNIRSRWSAVPFIPSIIIEQIAAKPGCVLIIQHNDKTDEYLKWSYTPYLSRTISRAMCSISSSILALAVIVPAADNETLVALGFLIASCPYLRTLQIRAVGHIWPYLHAPHGQGGGRLDGFTTVRNIDWLQKPIRSNRKKCSLQKLELINFCACDGSWPVLSEFIDTGHITDLSLTCHTLLAQWQLSVHHLSSLRLFLDTDRERVFKTCSREVPPDDLRRHLATCRSLRHLQILNNTSIVDEQLLKVIGLTLESLELHEYTTTFDYQTPRAYLNNAVLDALANSCPLLRTLALDAPYKDADVSINGGITSIQADLSTVL